MHPCPGQIHLRLYFGKLHIHGPVHSVTFFIFWAIFCLSVSSDIVWCQLSKALRWLLRMPWYFCTAYGLRPILHLADPFLSLHLLALLIFEVWRVLHMYRAKCQPCKIISCDRKLKTCHIYNLRRWPWTFRRQLPLFCPCPHPPCRPWHWWKLSRTIAANSLLLHYFLQPLQCLLMGRFASPVTTHREPCLPSQCMTLQRSARSNDLEVSTYHLTKWEVFLSNKWMSIIGLYMQKKDVSLSVSAFHGIIEKCRAKHCCNLLCKSTSFSTTVYHPLL